MPNTSGAIKRRAQSASTQPEQRVQGTANAAPSTPIVPGTPAQTVVGKPAMPSASAWVNPFPTQYTAVPIASPPANPDLTPQDIAAQIAEYSDWDRYLSTLGLTAANLSASTTTRVADIENALAQRLDNNNWDTAARGLAVSSIRDTNAAQANADAANSKGGAISALINQESFNAGEQNKWAGTGGAKQAIDAKYLGIAEGNRAAKAAAAAAAAPAAQPQNDPVPAPPAPQAPAPQSAPVMQTGAGIHDPFAPNSGGRANVFMQDSGSRKGLRYIITDGHRKYESKPGAGDWGKGGIIKIGG